MSQVGEQVWAPSAQRVERSNLKAFARELARRGWVDEPGPGAPDYEALHRWSVRNRAQLWRAVWDFCRVVGDGPGEGDGIGLDRMAPPDAELGPRWFPEARLNFAENLLRFSDDHLALVAWNERGRQRAYTYAELTAEVARVASALRRMGLRPGDRVAGYLPNLPETVIAMLASASIGAVWSSCSPDFGVRATVDRLGQIGPRVLFAADGYWYAGKQIDCCGRLAEIVAGMPTVERVVVVPYVSADPPIHGIRDAVTWDAFAFSPDAAADGRIEFERLPFDHPLYVMYSSGTTGLPKGMVHGAGGTLLQHLKELALHTDLKRGDRIFYYTTCGWMMWNWLVSSLAVGATVVLWDGAAMAPGPASLWDMAQAEGVTVFGTSAKYLALAEKEGVEPARTHDLSALRAILSTGSPLAPHSFDYVYRAVKADVHLASISGGTDIVSCFVLGNPTAPVYRGEAQCRGLGMAVEVWDEDGRPIVGEPGELVCTKPFPSMPVEFWADGDGARYRGAYFEHLPGVWRHGDWVELTPRGGLVIYGRSDATLNPGGVRIGTAEIYRQVEQVEEVVESLAIGQEIGGGAAGDVRVVLFVRLRPGLTLDDALRERIRRLVRENASPHHVPRAIVQVADVPRTISGKISEIAVREVVHGRPVKNTGALANPESLDLYRDLPELRT
ncbi:MAG: acsA [Gemmatimonadetes bacterium]|nr:acsA [Gemmatimonadota bacterium]